MFDTFSLIGSVKITLSHNGLDEIINGPNAISTECYAYLLDCLAVGGTTINTVSNMLFYYTVSGTVGSTIAGVGISRPTGKAAMFASTISNTVSPIRNIYEARLITSQTITYSTYSLPIITIPTGYTMSVEWS